MADQPTPQTALEVATAALTAADQQRHQDAELAEIQHPSNAEGEPDQ